SGLLVDTEPLDPELKTRRVVPLEEDAYEEEDSTLYSSRRARSLQLHPYPPVQERPIETDEELEEGEWEDDANIQEYLDPDVGIDEDPLEQRLIHTESPRVKAPGRRNADNYPAETYERG